IAVDEMPVGEDHVTKKARLFVVGKRLHDRIVRAGKHFPGFVEVEQQGAEAVTGGIGGRSVVDLQTALGCANRGPAGAHPGAVPHSFPAVGDTAMIAPVFEVGRLGNPDVIAAQYGTAGTVQGVVSAADLLS